MSFLIELKLLISLSLQTVSSDSEWFKSDADRVSGYEDHIVWKDGTASSIPHVSLFIANNLYIY